MEVVNFESLTDEYVADCLRLWHDRRASQRVNESYLRNSAADIEGFVCSVAVSKDDIVGFSLGIVSSFSTCVHVPYDRVSEVVDLGPRSDVGCISVVCVDDDHQDTFIFEELVGEVVTQLEEYDVSIVFEFNGFFQQRVDTAVVEAGLECEYSSGGEKSKYNFEENYVNDFAESQCRYKLYVKHNTICLGKIC